MKNKITKLLKLLLVFAITVLPLSFVNAKIKLCMMPHINLKLYMPHIYLAGYTGAHKNLLGKADILAPLLLTENNNLFAYAQGKTAYEARTWEDSTYTGSLALGFRQIVKDATVLGAYVFGDYTNSTSGHTFEVISPGIESLSRAWDFRANGYFPISSKRWVDEGWASEFGDYHYTEFTGYKQYDHWYQYYQETGPGADAEIGRNLFMLKGKFKGILFKGFLNGYYFDMKHNDDVVGGGARLIIQPSPAVKISLRDSYDNYEHNTFMMGVQLSFYDLINVHRSDPVDIQDLQRNLFVPIERNMGTIGLGSSIPVTQSDKPEDLGQRLEHDGVWFFKQGVIAGNAVQGTGTYEDPFTAFTMEEFNYVNSHYQNIGATIDPFPLLYFNSGAYPLTDFGDRFGVPAGWGMYGWVMYDTPINHPAMQTQRPVFIGGIDLLQGNNTLDSIAIHNNSGNQSSGLDIQANNINLNNIEVGALNNTTGYQTGIMIDGANNVNLNRSQVYGFDAVPITETAQAYGICVQDGSTLTLGDNNTVSSQTYGPNEDTTPKASIGIYAKNSSTVKLSGNGNTIDANSFGGNFGNITSSSVSVNAFARGLYAYNNSTVTISGSENTILATAIGGTVGDVSGAVDVDVYASANSFYAGNYSTVTISGSENTILATAIGGTVGDVSGAAYVDVYTTAYANSLYAESYSTVTMSGSGNTISGTATGGTVGNVSGAAYVNVYTTAYARGLYAYNNSTAIVSGSENTISGAATGGTAGDVSGTVSNAEVEAYAYGLSVRNYSTVTISGSGNTIPGTATGGTVGNVSGTVYAEASATAYAYGLYAYSNSTVTLSGSKNTILATATGGSLTTGVGVVNNDGKAYGIDVENGAILDIIDTATNTNITVNGSTDSWGIFADDDLNTHLKLNGVDIGDGDAYDTLITYTKLGATGDGHALEWKGKFSTTIPW